MTCFVSARRRFLTEVRKRRRPDTYLEKPMRDQLDMDSAASADHGPDGVFAWRRSQLVRSGFSPPLAGRVAHDGRYDLHRLIELVERGCPPELALRILAPLAGDEAA
jgi:hypothetical protein